MDRRIWVITGVSSGLGKALAELVMEQGDWVIGTFRQPEQVADFTAANAGRGSALQLDLTRPDQFLKVAQAVERDFGRIDVLVNNAGSGFAGAIEETTDAELRTIFETNFFGPIALTNAFLPLFRRQRSGHIIQLSSHGGVKAFPGFGGYNASKFALEGASEALAAEVAPLGIRVSIVEPGPFRTAFAGAGFGQAAQRLADYEPTAGAFRERMAQVHGRQEGDPAKAAEAIWQLSLQEKPPLRLPLGRIALASITSKIESLRQDVEASRDVASRAVFESVG
ncbi:SDR family NAD(P)-dependent oxidoreductase [Fibrisoma montanum]|uniref:SDR family NAD(P)-dependent oxidoreductase n=1 Tax=Fibrisoma montanum TaxID=2305895 RepID=A0A418MC85_9BACT|nr:oxidoreductase [Fibrisoma montanum]RIV23981.1 SDR family NAD(P)-dependent oxidoreductase [Fibrisoma montanum]